MPPLAIMGAISAGGAIAGGLAGKAKTTTTSGTYTRNLTQPQNDALSAIMDSIKRGTTQPYAGLDPLRSHVLQTIDKRYQGMPDAINKRFAARGMGQSGQIANLGLKSDLARAGDFASTDNQFSGLALNQYNHSIDLAKSLLDEDFSHSTTGTTTGPSNVASGAVSGGLETLMTLLMLNKQMGGSGGGGVSAAPAGTGIGGFDIGSFLNLGSGGIAPAGGIISDYGND